MGKNKLKWLTLSQSSVFFASSLIFPFYILFVKNIGSSYTQFGFSYGLFGLSGALIYPLLGRLSERLDSRYFLLANSLGHGCAAFVCPAYRERRSSVYRPSAVRALWGNAEARRKSADRRFYRQRRTRKENWKLPFLDCGLFSGSYYAWRLSRRLFYGTNDFLCKLYSLFLERINDDENRLTASACFFMRLRKAGDQRFLLQ